MVEISRVNECSWNYTVKTKLFGREELNTIMYEPPPSGFILLFNKGIDIGSEKA